jgi:AcrR family transcriptional regulator
MTRPFGVDEVRAALVTAARHRFAAEGPSASLRAIAHDAGVNLGLVHRYFGGKAGLLEAVLTDVLRGALPDKPFDSVDELLQAVHGRLVLDEAASQEYARILAWMLLMGESPRAYLKGFGEYSTAKIATPDQQSRYLLVLAAFFGWRIFGPHIAPMARYRSQKTAERDLFDELHFVVTSEVPAKRRTVTTRKKGSSKPRA